MKRGDIVLVELPSSASHVQSGHEQVGTRPALVVHQDATISSLPVVMIIPFTSNPSVSRFSHVIPVGPSSGTGLTIQSYLMVFQLRAIDKTRIKKKIGSLEESTMRRVAEEVKKLLGV